jgi:pyruvate formate lyase activating enzyme
LRVVGAEGDVEEILDEVELDRPFYEASGGGLTVSGGEPMAHFEFTWSLLRGARKRGFHTCLDTSGFGPSGGFLKVLPEVDLFLFDYKATKAADSRDWTGVSNDSILSNLDLLYRAGAAIALRCPLVPGVNDTLGHLKGIAGLSEKYPKLAAVEIMAYHALGRDKAARVGMDWRMDRVKPPEKQMKNRWLATLRLLGCDKARMG